MSSNQYTHLKKIKSISNYYTKSYKKCTDLNKNQNIKRQ